MTLNASQPEVYANEKQGVDYYKEVSEFANRMSLHMSCSNGVFKLGPTAISVQHYTETSAYQDEVKKFKQENPEYANMKGLKHKEPTSVSYLGNVGINGGNTGGSVRFTQLNRRLNYLTSNQNPYRFYIKLFLKKLQSNHYRWLILDKLHKKIVSCTELEKVLNDIGYVTISLNNRNKKVIRLNNEGIEYVKQFRGD